MSVSEPRNGGWTKCLCYKMERSSTIILSVLTDKVTGYTETLSYFVSEAINRSRIIYNLNNGSYKKLINGSPVSVMSNKIEYFIQSTPREDFNPGIAYWDGSGCDDSATDDDLAKSGREFTTWSSDINDLTGSVVYTKGGSETYKGFENITLYADYEPPVTPETPVFNFDASWISYKTSADGATDTSLGEAGTKVAVISAKKSELTSTPSITFTVNIDTDALGYYSSLKMDVYDSTNTLKGSPLSFSVTSSASAKTLSLSDFDPGVYTLRFTAEKRVGVEIFQEVTAILNLTD